MIFVADEREFKSMQEEAIRRVQEMQRRSKNYVGGDGADGGGEDSRGHTPTVDPVHTERETTPQRSAANKTLFNIAGIKIDEEKALIALMIYILYKNKADIKLLLGLGYLLL